jgi:lipoprotein-anchoring transpeptidase ErfK/SrfK
MAALPPEVRPETEPPKELASQFRRTLVDYRTKEPAGTIIIDTPNTYLYLVLGDGKALCYGVGVGREGYERHATTTTTAPARVDLDRSRCARAGVGPCGMARIVLKGCG